MPGRRCRNPKVPNQVQLAQPIDLQQALRHWLDPALVVARLRSRLIPIRRTRPEELELYEPF